MAAAVVVATVATQGARGEEEAERSSGAESTVTSVLCLHYDPSGRQGDGGAPRRVHVRSHARACACTHTVQTCAKGSTKILHSAHQEEP